MKSFFSLRWPSRDKRDQKDGPRQKKSLLSFASVLSLFLITTAHAIPTITVPGGTTTLTSSAFSVAGTPAVTISINATDLTPASGNLTGTAPANVNISVDGTTWTTAGSPSVSIPYTGGTLTSYPLYARLAGTGTPGLISGNISISGGGATTVTQAVSGTLTGTLYVSRLSDTTSLYQIAPNGTTSTLPLSGVTFAQPLGLAIGPDGMLYMSTAGSVKKINANGTVSNFASGFGNAYGIAFDSSGNLYVANQGGSTVSKVTPAGTVSTFASGINNPQGLAFDSAGNLFVTSSGNGQIKMVTPGGTVSNLVALAANSQGCAFDAAGNLYVSTGSAIAKVTFSSPGVFSAINTNFATVSVGRGVVTDGTNIYVANQDGVVNKITPDGTKTVLASGLTLTPYFAAYGVITAFPPTVQSLSPSSGPVFGGTTVTITGTAFTGATGVTIGGTAATNVSVINDTTITCTTPARTAGTASVVVTVPGGTNAANTLYTYVQPIPPTTIGFHNINGVIGNYYNGGAGPNVGIESTAIASGGWVDEHTNPTFNVPSGFTTGFAVVWNVRDGMRIRIFDGLDGTGTQLATQDFFGISGTASLAFSGTAKSVRLERFGQPDFLGYDTLTFGSTTVGTPVAEAPGVTTSAATSIGSTTATLNGSVNPGGVATTAQFEYGLTNSYGSTATVTLSPNNGSSGQVVSKALTGLTPNTTYHFRLTATNSAGTKNGSGLTFTTVANLPPTVSATNATVTVNEATAATNAGTFNDPDGNATVTLTASIGTITPNNVAGTWSWSYTPADGPASATVTITANDGIAAAVTTTFALTVNNVAPTATFSSSASTVNEATLSPPSVSFTNQLDPGTTDVSTGLKYSYDYNNDGTWDDGDGTYDGSLTVATKSIPASYFASPATSPLVVKGRIIDKDGGSTDYTVSIAINHAPTGITLGGAVPSVPGVATWSPMTLYSNVPAQVLTNGTRHAAVVFDPVDLTENGLLFDGRVDAGTFRNGSLISTNPPGHVGFITGAYGQLVRYGGFTTDTNGFIDITGLTVGATYQVQLFTPYWDNPFPSIISTAGGPSVTIECGYETNLPQSLVGTFTAAAATQRINWGMTTSHGGLAAISVRRVVGGLSLAENNAIGDTITTLGAIDADAGDTFTYSLVSGTGSEDNAAFSIVGNQLKAAVVFDYETKTSYALRVRASDASGAFVEKALTVSITDVAEFDYVITNVGGVLTIAGGQGGATTDDEIFINESGINELTITAAGRTFSSAGPISLVGITQIIFNAGSGNDVIHVGDFPNTLMPSLTINGNQGSDTVLMNGSITFADGASLDCNLQDDSATPGTDSIVIAQDASLVLTGAITLKASSSIDLQPGSGLIGGTGDIVIESTVTARGTTISTEGGSVSVEGNSVAFAASELSVGGTGTVLISGTTSVTLENSNVATTDGAVVLDGSSVTLLGNTGSGLSAGGSGTLSLTSSTLSIVTNSSVSVDNGALSIVSPAVQLAGVIQSTGTGSVELTATTELTIESVGRPVIVTNNGSAVDIESGSVVFDVTGNGFPVIVSSGPLNIVAPVTLDAATVSLLQAGSITVNSTPPATDYAVSIVNGVLTLTDLMGHGDTLAIDESGINEITFAAPGRTFSPAGPYSLVGITHIVVLAAGGDDVINVGDFPQTILPSLTIKGGRGNDSINLNGSLTFSDGASFTADLIGDDASPGVDSVTLAQDAEITLPADSEGTVTITTSSTLALQPGSAIQTGLGDITLEAQQATSDGARLVSEAGSLSLTAEDVELHGTEVDGSSIAMTSTTLLLENSNIQALGGDIAIQSGSLTLSGNLGTEIATTGSGSVSLTGDLVLAANSSVSVENGTLVVAGDAVSLEGQLVSAGTGSVSVTGETSLDLASTNQPVIVTNNGGTVDVFSSTLSLSGTSTVIVSSGPLNIAAPITLDAATVSLLQAGSITVNSTPPATDYAVSIVNGVLTLTDLMGHGDTLAIDESGINEITFSAPGRTFSPAGPYSLVGITHIVVLAANGDDIINVGDFPQTILPSLTIKGGRGNDTVNINGSLTFGDGASLTADLNGDDASPGVDSVTLAQDAEISLPADSEGTVTITTSSTLALQPGSAIQTGLGDITLEAQQATSDGARLASEAGALSLTAEDVELRSTEVDGSSIAMVSTTLLLENSNIQALGGDVVIESASLTLAGNLGTEIATTGSGSVSLTGDLVLAANSSVSVENGTLVVAGDAVSLEGQLVSAGTGSVSVTGETSLDLASTNQPVIVTNNGGTVDVFSSTLSLSGTSTVIVSSGPLNIVAPVTLDAATVSLLQAGSITVNSTPPATDYAVSIVNGVLTLTDLMGHGDTLAINESGINEITFSAPGRTFSPAGPYSLDGITHIVVLAAGGDDIINVGDFPQTILPSLTIKGGRGNDTVNLNGSLTFGDGASLTADLNGDDASPGTDSVTLAQDAEIILPADSEGTVTITTSSTLALQPGSAIQTGLGDITLEAQQATSEGARLVSEAGSLSLTAEDVELRSTEVDGSSIAMTSTTLLLENSNIQALGGDIAIQSGSLTLTGNLGTEIATTGSGSVSLTGDLVLAANSSVSVENGTLVVAGDAVSLEGQLVSAGTGSVSVTGETSLDLASTNQPVIVTNNGGTVDVFSSTLSLSGTSTVIVSSGPLNIVAPVTLDAATVSLLQAGSITVNSTPPATDYAVSIVNGVLTLTDLMGHGDTLAIDESGINEIAFSAPGRTFSPAGPYSLVGITHIVVLAANGDDIINVGDFPQTILPSLTIKGGRGNDTVNINGSLTFSDEASLTIDLQSDDASPGVDQIIVAQDAEISLPEDSTGSVTLRTSRNVSLAPGSAIIGGLGEVVIEANQQATPTSGDFVGIAAQGATIRTSGGSVSLAGRGGNTNEATANTPNVGVNLSQADVHVAGTGTVTFSGSSGKAAGVVFANSALTTEQGNVVLTGSSIEFTGNTGSEVSVGGSGTLSFDTTSLTLDGGSQLSVTDGVLNISSDTIVLQGQLIASGTGSIEVEAGTVTLDGSELPGSMALINTGSGHVNFTADSLSLDGAGNILINSEEGGDIEFASDSITITDSSNSGVPAISSSGNLNIETKTAGAPNPITLDTNTLALIQSGTLIVNQTTTNVAPATLTLAPVTVAENNAIGATVGTLSATDTDLPAQTLTFGFASGSGDEDNDSFTITGNALKAAESLDYETQPSYNVRLSVSDGFGGTLEKAFVVNISDVADTPLQLWRAANFPGLFTNTGNAANNADPDGDTYSNLLEFAFGTDPNNPASGPGEITFDAGAITLRAQPKLTVTNTATGVNFRANFGRRKDYVAAELTYTVQFSADMQSWVDGTATPAVQATDAEMEAVSVKYPFFLPDGRKARYHRVQVSVP